MSKKESENHEQLMKLAMLQYICVKNILDTIDAFKKVMMKVHDVVF